MFPVLMANNHSCVHLSLHPMRSYTLALEDRICHAAFIY